MAKDGPYRILSLDGGGVRGVLTARLIERIDAEEPGFLGEIDLYAGTSTGSILASGLAAGNAPSEMVEFYLLDSAKVFKDSMFDDIRDLGRLRGAEYSMGPLKRILHSRYGDANLGDLGKDILVPAFDLDNESRDPNLRTWKPKFFHNLPGKGNDKKELIADVVLRSCAAPVYFPSYQGYIDGGVVANNPAMAAVAQAMHSRKIAPVRMRLLSLSTGHNLEYIGGKRLDWGLAQWSPVLLRLLSASSMGVVDYQCRQLLGRDYHRLSTIYEQRIPTDAVRQIQQLIDIADTINISPTLRWIGKYWLESP